MNAVVYMNNGIQEIGKLCPPITLSYDEGQLCWFKGFFDKKTQQ